MMQTSHVAFLLMGGKDEIGALFHKDWVDSTASMHNVSCK
jgi:hypothetical protein